MTEIRSSDIGQVWLDLLRAVHRTGQAVGDETLELRNVVIAFAQDGCRDPRLARFAAGQPVEEMRKVFFSTEPNRFGYSYADKIRGPQGRADLSDVIELLAREPASKRAAVVLVGSGDGRVPCINSVHFLRRDEGLFVSYFSRGQDVFKKFYADACCLHEMGRRVASGLGVALVEVAGLVSSAHVYLADLPDVRNLLAKVDGTAPSPARLRERPA